MLLFKCAALVLPVLALKAMLVLLVSAAAGLAWLWPTMLWWAYQAASTIGKIVIGLVGNHWAVVMVVIALYILESEYRRHAGDENTIAQILGEYSICAFDVNDHGV